MLKKELKTSLKTGMLLAVLCSSPLQAMSRFDEGLAAFQAADYQLALRHFAAEQVAGRTDHELLYNIAICHYRLGQWSEANTLLAQLHWQNPEQDLIAYNLAVTEKKLGNQQRAHQLFLEVALTSTSPELAALANRQYQILAPGDVLAAPRHGEGAWLASADLSFGIDDNVIDPADLSGSSEDDTFTESLLTVRWHSAANPRQGWVVDGFGYLSRYAQVSEYDIELGDIGFRRYTSADFGFWYVGGRADTSQLGGDGYLQSLTVNVGAGGQLDNGNFWNAHYRYRGLASLSDDYAALDGSNQRFSLDYGGRVGAQSRWKIDYRYELDDREDLDYADGFSSYSAQRHSLGTSWAYTSGKWRASLRADYRYSDYLDDNLSSTGSAIGRQDNRYRLTLRGSWLFSPSWALSAEYGYTDNDSNIDSYDYTRQVMMLGVGWQL